MQNARTRRTVVVLLLAMLSVGLWVGDLRRVFGHPLGSYGFSVSLDSRVVDLEPGSPAEKAGVRNGNFIDYARMSVLDRLGAWYSQWSLDPGDLVRVSLIRGGSHYDVSFRTAPEPQADIPSVPIRAALAILFLCAGIIVVLRKPSPATWAFFIFPFHPAVRSMSSL